MGRRVERGLLMTDSMTDIVEVGRRAGHACWLEQRLFEIVGGWVAGTAQGADPALARLLAAHAHHHAWRAELWRDRLPELAEHPPAAATRPPNDDVTAFVEGLADADGSLDRLVGVYRVLLPRLASEYEAMLHATSPLTDGPTARVLQLCLADVADDGRAGAAALQSLIDSSGAAAAADARQADFEALAAAAGSFTG